MHRRIGAGDWIESASPPPTSPSFAEIGKRTAALREAAEVDPARYRRSVEHVIGELDALRKHFQVIDYQPYQVFSARPGGSVVDLDLTGEPDPEAAATAWMTARARTPVDLLAGR